MVSLSKNQTVSLSKDASSLNQRQFGLGWGLLKKKKVFFASLLGGDSDSIDLDAGCVLLEKSGKTVAPVWFRHLKSNCGSIVHQRDNLAGEGDGGDQVIIVDLIRLASPVEYFTFTLNSFRAR